MTALSQRPLDMTTGSGENLRTRYSCATVDKAKEEKRKVLVARRHKKTGKLIKVAMPARKVHRGLLDCYGETHELAGQGKFVALQAFKEDDRTQVFGAQHVTPYLREDGLYHTVVEVLKRKIGVRALARLHARVSRGSHTGVHLLWEGRRNKEDCLLFSDWFTLEQLWEMCCDFNSDLLGILRRSKSGLKGAAHKSAKEKFEIGLNVLRRATSVVDVATGEQTISGGRTPYSKPLEQCGFAIDKRFLTYDVDENGDDLAQYYYRLVIGRPEPHVLSSTSWKYESGNSAVAFKSEKARKALRSAAA